MAPKQYAIRIPTRSTLVDRLMASLGVSGLVIATLLPSTLAPAFGEETSQCLPITSMGPLNGAPTWFPAPVSLAFGKGGDLCVAGVTPSPDRGTAFSFQPRPRNTNGTGATFSAVARLLPDGSPDFVAYLGGSGPYNNTVSGIATDSSRHVYVTGAADSADFPLHNPTGVLTPSAIDVYVTKISPDGGSVIFSTLIGGRATELPTALGANDQGEVFVAGWTGSPDFQTQPTDNLCDGLASGVRPFVAKFGPDGALLFSRQFGPPAINWGITQLAPDGAGGVWVGGTTTSASIPLAVSGPPGGATNNTGDSFVAHLNGWGDLVAAAYLGGRQADTTSALLLLPDGDLLVACRSNSPDFTGAPLPPGRTNAVIPRLAYLVRMSADARVVRWSRRLETSAGCEITQLCLLPDGTAAALAYTSTATAADGSAPVNSSVLGVDPEHGRVLGAIPLPSLDLRPGALAVSDDGMIRVAGTAFWNGPPVTTVSVAAMPVRCEIPISSLSTPAQPTVRWLTPSPSVPGVLASSAPRNLLSIGLSVEDWRGEVSEVQLYDSGMLLARWTSPPYSLAWTNPDPRLHSFRVRWRDVRGELHDSVGMDYPVVAAGPTDRFATRTMLPGDGVPVVGSVLGCTLLPPSPDGREVCGNSAWFGWSSTQDTLMRCDASSLASSGSEVLTLEAYEGTTLAGLKLLGTGGSSGTPATFTFGTQGGKSYAFRVQAAPGRPPTYPVGSGLGQFRLLLGPATPLPNDNRSAPSVLSGSPVMVPGSTRGATPEPTDGTFRFTTLPNTVWYSWTAPEARAYLVAAASSSGLPVLLKAFTPAGTSVMNEGDVERGLVFTPNAGWTYVIEVGSANPGTDFTLSVRPSSPPVAGVIQESGESWSSSVNTFLTSPSTPRLLPSWQWTAPRSGSYSLHAEGEFLNATLSVKPLAAAAPPMSTTSDPNAASVTGAAMDLVFGAEAGSTYLIGFAAGPPASVDLRLQPDLAAPPNDDYANPIEWPDSLPSIGGTTRGASPEAGEPVLSRPQESAWYTWTATREGVCVLSVDSSACAGLVLCQGDSLSQLVTLATNRADNTLRFGSHAGARYHLEVASRCGNGLLSSFGLRRSFPPANDEYTGAFEIPADASSEVLSLRGATLSSADPAVDGFAPGSAWWRWSPSSNGVHHLSLSGSEGLPLLRFHRGQTKGAPILLSPAESYTNTVLNAVDMSFDLRTNEVYFLEVLTGCDADVQLHVVPLNPPPNDAVANRTALMGAPTGVKGSVLGATADKDIQGLSNSRWIWWSWVPPEEGVYRVSTDGSQFTPTLVILDGPSLPVAVSRLYTASGSTSSGTARFLADAGREVVLGLTAPSAGSGPGVQFSITPVIQPANDRFESPEVLDGARLDVRGLLRQPTAEAGEPGLSSRFSGGSLWYAWTPPIPGIYYVGSSPVNGTGPVITAYSGDTLANLIPQAVASPAQGRFTIAELGGPLRIQVAGIGTDAGAPFRFLVLPRTREPNDMFAGALPLPGTAGTNALRTLWATSESGEPVPAAAPYTNSLWFWFTAAASGKATFGSTDFPLACTLFKGSELGTLTPLTGNVETVSGLFRQTYSVVAGTSYRLQVSSASGLPAVTFTWILPASPGGQPQTSPALTASLVSWDGGQQVRMRVTQPAGAPTVVESSTDLSQWFPLLTNINLGMPLEFLAPVETGAPQQFFRLSSQP